MVKIINRVAKQYLKIKQDIFKRNRRRRRRGGDEREEEARVNKKQVFANMLK